MKNKFIFIRNNILNIILNLMTVMVLFSCAEKSNFTSTDITGSNIGTAPWVLQNAQGMNKTVTNFKGKIVVIFFGFTRCPEVCPTTLIDYAAALKALGAEASKVQVIFVTLDPQRDTFPTLQQFTSAFNPSFIALRGDEAATKTAADAFKVFYAKSKDDVITDKNNTVNYSIDHTAASYIFDTNGNIRLFVRNDQPVDRLVQDLKILLNNNY
jgi:protein SCO1/2